MAYKFAGQEVEVPFGPAPGAISGLNLELILSQARDVLRSPVGAAWMGSFTAERNEGNTKYGRIFYIKESTGETVNSMAFPNVGFQAIRPHIKGLSHMASNEGKVLIPSVAYLPHEDPLEVLPKMAYDFFAANAQAVEIDYSCPNHILVGGGRAPMLGHDPDLLLEVRAKVISEIGLHQNLLEKLPSYLGEKAQFLPRIARGYMEIAGVSYISVMNSLEDYYLLDEDGNPALDVPGNLGGLSGPATAEIAREQLMTFRELIPAHIGLVSCNGVDNGGEAHYRVEELGADFTAGVTVYLRNESKGMGYGKTNVLMAEQYAEKAAA